MAIAADQLVDTGYDFKAKQVPVPHPITGERSGYYMNVREDNDDIVGWTTAVSYTHLTLPTKA